VASLQPEWLTAQSVSAVFNAFEVTGCDLRAVGGCVRDALLGRPVSDIDLATPAPPEQVLALAQAAGLKAIPTGLSHGTVTVVAEQESFQITTLRKDIETDGRHAKVAFTDDWQQDAARRDFTMNALYLDRNGSLTDFFGGVEDARAGRVRFIGSPDDRIQEDYLRILRFFRFQAHYGNAPIDEAARQACARHARGVAVLSGERVQAELLKLLEAPRTADFVDSLNETGVSDALFGRDLNAQEIHRLEALGREHDIEFPLLAVLAVTIAKDPAAATARLKLSNAQRDGVCLLYTSDAADE